jgi:hypothetical protein
LFTSQLKNLFYLNTYSDKEKYIITKVNLRGFAFEWLSTYEEQYNIIENFADHEDEFPYSLFMQEMDRIFLNKKEEEESFEQTQKSKMGNNIYGYVHQFISLI